jgi:hypothetical protein
MIMSIIALLCLGFIAWIFLSMETENIEGAGVMKAILMAVVAIPAGVIVGGLF